MTNTTAPNLTFRRTSDPATDTTDTAGNSEPSVPPAAETPVNETRIDMENAPTTPDSQTEQNGTGARPTPMSSLRNLSGHTRNLFNFYIEHAYNNSNGATNTGNSNNTDAAETNADRQEESMEEFTWRIVTRPPASGILAFMVVSCLALTFVKEMSIHLGLFLSVVVAFTHYHDGYKFSQIQKGETMMSIYPIILCIFLRNFVVAVMVGLREVLQVAGLMLVPGGEDSFVITVVRVILAEILIQDVVLTIKILLNLVPMNPSKKRRSNVFIEHSSYLYRTAVPFAQWAAYFSPPFLFTFYLVFKMYFFITRIVTWFRFLQVLTTTRNIGEVVEPAELDAASTCSICQSSYTLPRKMKCSHIFCTNCITTWAETSKGNTCPLCRSHILPPNSNKFSDFEEKYPLVMF